MVGRTKWLGAERQEGGALVKRGDLSGEVTSGRSQSPNSTAVPEWATKGRRVETPDQKRRWGAIPAEGRTGGRREARKAKPR